MTAKERCAAPVKKRMTGSMATCTRPDGHKGGCTASAVATPEYKREHYESRPRKICDTENCAGMTYNGRKHCGECCLTKKRYDDRNHQREQRAHIAAIKAERGCTDCGNSNPVVLDFDHRPGVQKLWNVSAMRGMRWSLIEVEIAKCDVRCGNCHRIVTAERRK